MAEINLGNIKFNWKGAYAGGTAYVVDDVVESGGSSYVCILASTGNTPPNGTYWNLMAQGGTGSAATLTTTGDMLYRDGSGLQRLAIGTAGQELKVNSGATAPEWYTPAAASSDFVKIHDSNLSGASTYTISNVFSTTYNSYIVELQNYTVHSNGGSLYVRMVTSGGVQSGNEYYFANAQVTRSSGSNSNGNNSGWGDSEWWLSNGRTDPLYASYANMTFSNVGFSSYPRMTSASIAYDGTSQIRGNQGGYLYNGNITATGIYFFSNGSNNWQGTVRVYGRK